MVAILQLASEIHYHRPARRQPGMGEVKAEVLGELGLGADGLPEFIDVVLERFTPAMSMADPNDPKRRRGNGAGAPSCARSSTTPTP